MIKQIKMLSQFDGKLWEGIIYIVRKPEMIKISIKKL